jgi:hypothetical protein
MGSKLEQIRVERYRMLADEWRYPVVLRIHPKLWDEVLQECDAGQYDPIRNELMRLKVWQDAKVGPGEFQILDSEQVVGEVGK